MRHRSGSFGLVLLAMALASASACSAQREGERCDKQSGNDDCETGLICTTLSSSSSGDQAAQGELLPAVCCPPQGQHASAQVCTAGGLTPTEPTDAGSGGASGAAGQAGAAGEASGGEAGQGGTGGEGGAVGSMDSGGTARPDASSADGG